MEDGGGLGWSMVTVQTPNGLGEMWGVQVRGWEAEVNRPGSQSGQIHTNGRHSQSRIGAVGHEA